MVHRNGMFGQARNLEIARSAIANNAFALFQSWLVAQKVVTAWQLLLSLLFV